MAEIQYEDRLITENGVEARVANIVEPILHEMGYRLVRVKLSQLNGQTLQVMAERPDGTMSVEDCEAVSHAVSPVLDIEDPIADAYDLQISSPGIDRLLVRTGDFARWAGHDVKIEMREPVNGRRRFKGRIVGANDRGVTIQRADTGGGESEKVELTLSGISEARLVLSDDLIREALKRDKAQRRTSR